MWYNSAPNRMQEAPENDFLCFVYNIKIFINKYIYM